MEDLTFSPISLWHQEEDVNIGSIQQAHNNYTPALDVRKALVSLNK